jgi:hypothetical protein
MKRLLAFGVSGLAAVIATAVLVAPALGTDPRTLQANAEIAGGSDSIDLARAFLVSLKYPTPQQAIAAGYVIDSPCVSDPVLGGMGVHYAHLGLMNDPAIDAAKPEVLVYNFNRAGQLRLSALEYFRRAADQNPADGLDQSDKPVLFGMPFDGIMPAHAPHHGWHYDLHVWIWQFNPSGMFFPFNPTVHCPS